MEKSFVYYIGPIDDEKPSFYLVVVCPNMGEPQEYSSSTLDDAMRLALSEHPADILTFEESLEEQLPDLGIETSRYSAHQALDVGKTIYNLIEPGYMDDIEQPGLIYQFLVGASEVIKQQSWKKISDFELVISGSENYSSFGMLIAGDGEIESLLLFDTKEDREVAARILQHKLAQTNDVKVDATVVSFSDTPIYATNALKRSFSLPLFPKVYHLFDQKESRVLDTALAAVTGTMFAIARIGKNEERSFGQLKFPDLEIKAEIKRG